MLIVCPNCATSYQVEPPSLSPGGRSLRCTRCQNVWFAAAPLAIAYDLDMLEYEPRVFALHAPEEPATQSVENFQATDADHALVEGTGGDITVTEAPSLVPLMARDEGRDPPGPASPRQTAEDIEIFKRRPVRPQAALRRPWPVPSLSAAILALIVANTILIAWRSDVVRLLPQTASLYAAAGMPVNLRGLAFENVKMSRDLHDGVSMLVVEGSLVNVAGRAVEVPRLRLSVRNDTRNEIYAWTTVPVRSILGRGEMLSFRSRLASPPAGARDVLVRFFNPHDIVAGLR